MTARGHMLLSIPIAIAIDKVLHVNFFGNYNDMIFNMIFFTSVIVGSLLPDIDEPESYIGRRFPIFSYAFSIFGALTPTKFIEHRGFTHMLFVPLIIIYFSYVNDDLMIKALLYGLSIGIFAHDCGDMLTKGGIRGFFFPLFPRTRIGLLPVGLRFITDSITEDIVKLLIIVLIILYSLNYFHLIG